MPGSQRCILKPQAGILRKKSSSKDLEIAGVTVGVLSPTTHDGEVGCSVALSICKFCCPVCDVHVAIHQGDLQDALAVGTIDLVFTALNLQIVPAILMTSSLLRTPPVWAVSFGCPSTA